MSLESGLKQIGLEEKEAKIYLAALELGPTNIQNLAKKAEIKRSTVYEILKSLKTQGLISETTNGKRKLILAVGPENLKRNIRIKEQILNDMLPDLISLNNLNPIKPKIIFYEGKEGHKEIYRDTLKAKEKVALWIAPIKTQEETIGKDFLDKYIEERVKKKIRIKIIQKLPEEFPKKYVDPKISERQLKMVRIMPDKLQIPNIIAIYDNKVAIMSTRKEGFGFVVESNDYAQSTKVLFDLLWNISKSWGDLHFTDNEENKSEDDYWSVRN